MSLPSRGGPGCRPTAAAHLTLPEPMTTATRRGNAPEREALPGLGAKAGHGRLHYNRVRRPTLTSILVALPWGRHHGAD